MSSAECSPGQSRGAATPSGNGYWLVASDGGIFGFGDARLLRLDGAPWRSTNRSSGWPRPRRAGLLDGERARRGASAFGNAGFFGSTGRDKAQPANVGMAATPAVTATGWSRATAGSSRSGTRRSRLGGEQPATGTGHRNRHAAERHRLLAETARCTRSAQPVAMGRRPQAGTALTKMATPRRPRLSHGEVPTPAASCLRWGGIWRDTATRGHVSGCGHRQRPLDTRAEATDRARRGPRRPRRPRGRGLAAPCWPRDTPQGGPTSEQQIGKRGSLPHTME